MNVKELREHLEKFSDDLVVVTLDIQAEDRYSKTDPPRVVEAEPMSLGRYKPVRFPVSDAVKVLLIY